MKSDSLFLGLLVALIGAVLVATSWAYPALPGQAYGAGTMPRVVGSGGVLLGLVLIFQGWRQGASRQRFALGAWARDRRGLGVLSVLLAAVVYILAADLVGFIPVASTVLIALMLIGRVQAVTAVITALVASVLVYVVFSRFLLVPLPRGPVESLLW